MAKKSNFEFYGSEEILKSIEEAGANVEQEIVKALRFSAQKPSDEMQSFIRGHKARGLAEKSWVENLKISKKGIIDFEAGFSVRKGGLGAVFHNLGTPRLAPAASFFVDKAVDDSIDSIIAAQQDALIKSFRNIIK